MLSWGLLASLVLHWVVFDLMRGAISLPRMPGATALQVRLKESASQAEIPSQEGPTAKAAQPPVLADTRPVPAGATTKIQTAYSAPMAASDTRLPRSENQPPVGMQIEGLRSGESTEAMVAMRLAIAQSLNMHSVFSELPAQTVLLWCNFDTAGHLQAVRSESGPLSPGLQASVQKAVAQIVVPESLVGQAFSLDLLFESGD
jgi:hypothetical protein